MPRLLVADDHVLIREGLRKVLSREPDMRIVGETGDFAGLLALVESTPADVALMDINMPGAGAFDTLKRIRGRRPGLPVLVLSMMPENQIALELLIGGAAGYVCKESAADQLVTAIRKVAGGARYLGPAFSPPITRSTVPSHELLSPRELEVLCHIAGGLAVKEIAARLALSVSTVHSHRAHVLEKLGMRSDVELSRYAIRHGLVV